jgi:hypothetical protein
MTADPSGLHELIFEDVRPTFMHVVGTFVQLSRFHYDARFASQYVPLYESWDGPPEWPSLWRDEESPPPFAGDYVRRDVLGPNLERLPALKAAYVQQQMQRSVGPFLARRDGYNVTHPLLPRAVAAVYSELVGSSFRTSTQ